MVGVMALYGWAADYPRVHPNDYVGSQVAAAAGVIDTGCLDQIVTALVGIPAETFYRHNPLDSRLVSAVARRNDPGHVRSRSPLLIVSGSADTFVVPARTQYLVHQLCRIGQVTQVIDLAGAAHDNEMSRGASQISDWLNDRLERRPVPNSCPQTR